MTTILSFVPGNIGKVVFDGVNGPSGGPIAISVPGLKVGDIVFYGTFTSSDPGPPLFWTAPENIWEAVVSVNDELQQLGGNMAGKTCTILFVRGL